MLKTPSHHCVRATTCNKKVSSIS